MADLTAEDLKEDGDESELPAYDAPANPRYIASTYVPGCDAQSRKFREQMNAILAKTYRKSPTTN